MLHTASNKIMTAFGFISLFVAALSVAVIFLHYQIIKKRTPVDMHLSQLAELLRQRLDIISSLESDSVLHSHEQEIDIAEMMTAIAMAEDEHKDSEYLTQNSELIANTTADLNQAIDTYNVYINSKPHILLMAKVLGLETVHNVEEMTL